MTDNKREQKEEKADGGGQTGKDEIELKRTYWGY